MEILGGWVFLVSELPLYGRFVRVLTPHKSRGKEKMVQLIRKPRPNRYHSQMVSSHGGSISRDLDRRQQSLPGNPPPAPSKYLPITLSLFFHPESHARCRTIGEHPVEPKLCTLVVHLKPSGSLIPQNVFTN